MRRSWPHSTRSSALLFVATLALVAPAGAFDSWTDSALYDFEYRVDLASIQAGPGQQVRLWVPAPVNEPAQRVQELEVSAPHPHQIARDAHGNRIVHLTWRGATSGELRIRSRVRRAPSRAVAPEDAHRGTPLDPARYTAAASRISLNGVVRALGEQESRGAVGSAEKVRNFYDYVTATMKYSKHGDGWGQGDAVWACGSRYGNCTDFHSVFIGMARSQGIPARFLIGFPIPAQKAEGEIPGYHCWSEAWLPDAGWWPLDASEAWKSQRIDDYYGTLPSDRVRFSVGRDLVLSPPQAGEPLNYFIYPYAEVDGVAVEQVPARFHFRRLSGPTVSH